MKKHIFQRLAIASIVMASAQLKADDELVVYVLKDGSAYQGVTVVLDNLQTSAVDQNGIAELDLLGGGHAVQIKDGDETVHAFRFDSADGQLVDITAVLDSGAEPQVGVENYYPSESALDRVGAAEGGIGGTVYSEGSPAAGAEVELGSEVVTTNQDGSFQIQVPRGLYDLLVTYNGDTEYVDEFRVITNVVKQVSDIRIGERNASASPGLQIEVPSIEEVTVVGTFNPSMFGESEQFSSGVVNTMGSEALARFGGGDVAASVGRMPSVSVQDDKYIFIRGLGGRYITTTLNSSTLPSTDPNKRTVPLDLFPTNMVDQLDVKKTFLAYMPGETTGGNLEINTRAFPDQLTTKVSVTLGGNADITGDSVAFDSHDGDFDLFGFDDGTRGESATVGAIATLLDETATVAQLDEFVETTLNEIGTLELIDNMDLASETAAPDVSAGFSIGGSTYLNDYEIGVFSAVNYSNTWSVQKDGVQRSYSSGELTDDYATSRSANNIELSGLLSVGVNVGNHSYETVTMVSRTTKNETSTLEGFDGDALANTYSYTMFWEEREFLSQQLRGEHIFGDLSADWQITGSQAWRYAPDRREVRFDEEQVGEPYVLSYADIIRNWEELTDTNADASVDFDYDFQFDTDMDWESRAEFGVRTIYRERLTESATYGFTGNAAVVDDLAPNRLFSDVINEGTVTGDQFTGFAFVEETQPSDEYEAEMELDAVYLSWENNFSGLYEFIVGARYEDYLQTTDTFSLTGDQGAVQSEIDESVTLPSFAFNWYYSLDQQLRFAASETVSRPDFKESSNAVFYDTEFSNVRVRGNPFIEVSSIKNYDLRWEMYGEGENKLSVAFFYKDIEDAIERVALTASGTAGNSRTFENADSAEISGVEVDFRRDFGLNDSLTKSVFVAGNASIIDSESVVEGEPTRELQGQPDYTFNLIFGWDDLENDQELTLILNQNGKSIRDVGIQGLGDIIQEPRLDVSLSYNWQPNPQIGLKAKLQNILDEDVEYTQEGEIFQSYGKGVSFSLGVDYEF